MSWEFSPRNLPRKTVLQTGGREQGNLGAKQNYTRNGGFRTFVLTNPISPKTAANRSFATGSVPMCAINHAIRINAQFQTLQVSISSLPVQIAQPESPIIMSSISFSKKWFNPSSSSKS